MWQTLLIKCDLCCRIGFINLDCPACRSHISLNKLALLCRFSTYWLGCSPETWCNWYALPFKSSSSATIQILKFCDNLTLTKANNRMKILETLSKARVRLNHPSWNVFTLLTQSCLCLYLSRNPFGIFNAFEPGSELSIDFTGTLWRHLFCLVSDTICTAAGNGASTSSSFVSALLHAEKLCGRAESAWATASVSQVCEGRC